MPGRAHNQRGAHRTAAAADDHEIVGFVHARGILWPPMAQS